MGTSDIPAGWWKGRSSDISGFGWGAQPAQGVGHVSPGGLIAFGVAPGVFAGASFLVGLWAFGRGL